MNNTIYYELNNQFNRDIPNEIYSPNYYQNINKNIKIQSLFNLLNVKKYCLVWCAVDDFYNHNEDVSVVFNYNCNINYQHTISLDSTVLYTNPYSQPINQPSIYTYVLTFYKNYPTCFKVLGDYILMTKPKESQSIIDLLYSNNIDNFEMAYQMILTVYNLNK